MLNYIDKTPKEFGLLSWDERLFYSLAWNKHVEDINASIKKSSKKGI